MNEVILVGAGPGDPDLLTLAAVKALQQATVVLVDDLVNPETLQWVGAGARIVPVGKRGGCLSTPQEFIHRLMVAEARNGERVVRLKGGDPFVFGRGGEEADALREAGIAVRVIGGLTSGIAAPAAIGIPVTDRRHSRGVAFVTGHTGDDGIEPDWAALAGSGLTLVIYMGVKRWPLIANALMAGGMAGTTPAAAVRDAHGPNQRAAVATLGGLAPAMQAAGIGSPAIIVVGEVVRLADAALRASAELRPSAWAGRSPSAAARHRSSGRGTAG